jgi:Cse1
MGVLKTANSIFKRFRHVGRSNELHLAFSVTLHAVQEPLLALFKNLGQAVDWTYAVPVVNKALLARQLEALRLVCRIFYSLNLHDLPIFFLVSMPEWMEEFAKHLQSQIPAAADPNEEYEPSPLDKLQAAIITNLALYMGKDEEPFLVYLPNFTTLVWNGTRSSSPRTSPCSWASTVPRPFWSAWKGSSRALRSWCWRKCGSLDSRPSRRSTRGWRPRCTWWLTKLLFESPVFRGRHQAWIDTLTGVVALLTSPVWLAGTNCAAGASLGYEMDGDDAELENGYDAQFSTLTFASRTPEDFFPEVPKALRAFCLSLHQALESPSPILHLVQTAVNDDRVMYGKLKNMMKKVGLKLVGIRAPRAAA